MTCPDGPHTHSISEVCEMIGCASQDWLIDRVRSGMFPARRIVRELRFTDDDVKAILDCSAASFKTTSLMTIPTPTSRSRRQHIA